MKRSTWFVALAFSCTAGMPLSAQTVTKTSDGDVDEPPVIDTGATNALNRMGTYLRTLKAMQIKADVTNEEVLKDGQKVQFQHRVDMVAERPNRFRAELSSDRKQRTYIFDGSNFTLFAPRQNFYTTVPAVGTIAQLADKLEDKYGMELPLVDLFRWGTPEAEVQLKAAKDIGPATINGITTQHYAFRQDGADWQVWIQNGDFPLPLKVVITTLTDDARPQYEAVYTWNLAPSFDDDAFAFTAPKDAKKIALAEVEATRKSADPGNGNGGKP